MIERALIGCVLAGAVAWWARTAGSLTTNGAVMATVVGGITVAAGWSWGVLLMVFFFSSSALSRWRASVKERRTGGIVQKGGARDAVQVLANGGVFAAAALGHLNAPSDLWLAIAGGALAAAAADTWATEIGTAVGGTPRSIRTFAPVLAGESGGITLEGSLSSIAGAAVLAATGLSMGWPRSVVYSMFFGGVAGSLADSVLGATLQERRRCVRCGAGTERLMHTCGGETRVVGGVPGFGNDLVNLASVAFGGAVAWLLIRGIA